jgi:hypothetical protein
MNVDQLTRSTLFNLLCGDGEDTKHFDQYIHNHISHRSSWWHFRIRLEALEKVLDVREDVNEHM